MYTVYIYAAENIFACSLTNFNISRADVGLSCCHVYATEDYHVVMHVYATKDYHVVMCMLQRTIMLSCMCMLQRNIMLSCVRYRGHTCCYVYATKDYHVVMCMLRHQVEQIQGLKTRVCGKHLDSLFFLYHLYSIN